MIDSDLVAPECYVDSVICRLACLISVENRATFAEILPPIFMKKNTHCIAVEC